MARKKKYNKTNKVIKFVMVAVAFVMIISTILYTGSMMYKYYENQQPTEETTTDEAA